MEYRFRVLRGYASLLVIIVLSFLSFSCAPDVLAAGKPLVIRVGLPEMGGNPIFTCKEGMSAVIPGVGSITLSSQAQISALWNGSKLNITLNDPLGTMGSYSVETIRLSPTGNEPLALNGCGYRGILEVWPTASGIRVIDELPMEEYLLSVVPAEMYPSWNPEALKAQAVAARTFATRNMLKHSAEGFNLCAQEHCQVYKGMGSESAKATQAVLGTEGIIATYKGKAIDAQYHSSSGGMTEDSQNVWVGVVPYLKGVESPEPGSPYSAWTMDIGSQELSARFDKAGYKLGDVLDILPAKASKGGRLITALVRGSKSSVELSGSKVRSILGLYSTLFVVDELLPMVQEDAGSVTASPIPGSFRISGRGLGHGVGMSQWGAEYMAELGYTYDSILRHYYSGIELEKWTYK